MVGYQQVTAVDLFHIEVNTRFIAAIQYIADVGIDLQPGSAELPKFAGADIQGEIVFQLDIIQYRLNGNHRIFRHRGRQLRTAPTAEIPRVMNS